MISMLIGTVGSMIAIAGWFGFRSMMAVFIGFGFYLLETYMEIAECSRGWIIAEQLIFGVGCLSSEFFDAPWLICGMLASCFFTLIVGVIGIVAVALGDCS